MASVVAETILQQFGGGMAMKMIGGYNLVGFSNALSFRFKAQAKERLNTCKITLTPMDVYELEFGRIWGGEYKKVDTVEDVYCDMLMDTFESRTGLCLTLSPRTEPQYG